MANPHWRIWVDWNGNGVWGETAGDYREEVADDVLELKWSWGTPDELPAPGPAYRTGPGWS